MSSQSKFATELTARQIAGDDIFARTARLLLEESAEYDFIKLTEFRELYVLDETLRGIIVSISESLSSPDNDIVQQINSLKMMLRIIHPDFFNHYIVSEYRNIASRFNKSINIKLYKDANPSVVDPGNTINLDGIYGVIEGTNIPKSNLIDEVFDRSKIRAIDTKAAKLRSEIRFKYHDFYNSDVNEA